MSELDTAKYVALTTYKRDGSPVSCPVWITGSAGRYELVTGDATWKVRRLRRDPRVLVQASDVRGRVLATATQFEGTGVVVDAPDEVQRVNQAVRSKYGAPVMAVVRTMAKVRSLLGRGDGAHVVIQLSLPTA
jgi:uncharacterized protein